LRRRRRQRAGAGYRLPALRRAVQRDGSALVGPDAERRRPTARPRAGGRRPRRRQDAGPRRPGAAGSGRGVPGPATGPGNGRRPGRRRGGQDVGGV
ncbi:MAG: N5-carboxyaminoimidazole ribonucleotide mutase, partial [uncultured Thermomicrobiales bacterium]